MPLESTKPLSSGWRSDLNRRQLGYFRTDDETTARVCAMLIKDGDYKPHVYDPCCGEGIALVETANYLDGISYGVEYDEARFRVASSSVHHLLHGDSIAEFFGSAKWAGLLWFNPPYDTVTRVDGSQIRLERVFWERHADRLAKGGVLVAILPDYFFDREPDMPNHLSWYFAGSDVKVYRAPNQTYKQIVLIGQRSVSKHPAEERNFALAEQLRGIGSGAIDLPELPPVGSGPLFIVPEGCAPQHFEVFTLTPAAIEHLAETYRGDHLRRLDELLKPASLIERRRSIMPLRQGHIPALLASGGLNGVVEDANGRFLVRGMARRMIKTSKKVQETDEQSNSTETTINISIHTFITTIMAWDLTPGRGYPLIAFS